MTGNPFIYPTWDLLTMTQLDSLPYYGVSFGEQMNQPGPWSGALLLADPKVRALNYLSSSRTGRTLLCVEYNNVIVWGGIIWTRKYSESSKIMQIGAQEIGSYFQQRLQAADYSTTFSTPTDPMQIAKRVINDATAVSGGSIGGGVTVVLNPVGGSGQLISASYPGTQLQTIDNIVSSLASMGYTFGFDYSFDVAYAPGTKTPAITLNLWYPRMGRIASQSQIIIAGTDCIDWTYDEDSTKQANQINESGGSGGGIQPIVATATIPGYPLLQAAMSHPEINDEGILSNIAFGDLASYSWPVVTPTLTLPVPLPDANGVVDPTKLGFGQFRLGDNAIFKIDPVAGEGLNTSPRFPDGLSYEWRISNWTCAVADEGISKFVFDISIPPVNTIPPPAPPLA